ncbi:MAG: Stp1/IreP family PP2C-type Ser/Thr phosphatase [Clostridia bacterium]|nr:Stp1/IreP family PP2C-type Ser/Thr phosphatase [Clostridia bacterium]
MKMYGATDIGLVRTTNQDNFYIDTAGKWAVVADGMGGHNGGETASTMAVEEIKKSMSQGVGLKESVINANAVVYRKALEDDKLLGMGTTVVLCEVVGELVNIAHVGDSRAYLYKDHRLKQITKDHSIVQQLIDSGTITEEQAKYHPQRNLITRAVGTERNILVDYNTVEFGGKDCILICSDGLSSYVDESEILQILEDTKAKDTVGKLIEAANEKGGKDNITVVLIKG